jgi:hypothetical protein
MLAKYLLIGDGRVSTHFGHYFRMLGLPVQTWSRRESESERKRKESLAEKAAAATHILALINDPAIETFFKENQDLFADKIRVHASGLLSTPLAEGTHPLMTFVRDDLYDLATYKSIPFVLEKGRRPFREVLPGLPNPSFEIEPADKVLYHTLCVLSGNFTVLLWQKAFTEFEARLKLPREILLPYLRRVAANLETRSGSALTGPLARGDQQTISKHLKTLEGDPYEDIYQAFVQAVEATRASAPTDNPGESIARGGTTTLQQGVQE